jgi:hypothetical protein
METSQKGSLIEAFEGSKTGDDGELTSTARVLKPPNIFWGALLRVAIKTRCYFSVVMEWNESEELAMSVIDDKCVGPDRICSLSLKIH